MLGRLQMTVPQCIEAYTSLSGEVFGKPKIWKWSLWRAAGGALYDATNLEKQINTVIAKHVAGSRLLILDSEGKCILAYKHRCRTAVTAVRPENSEEPKFFRSYAVPGIPEDHCEVWEAARATTAAKFFFDAVEIGGIEYLDGALGFGNNNPSQLAVREARYLGREVQYVVSIGTGTQRPVSYGSSMRKLVEAQAKMITSCREVDNQMEATLGDRKPRAYFRFDVDRGLDTVVLDEWKKQGEIAAHTEAYMDSPLQLRFQAELVNIMDAN